MLGRKLGHLLGIKALPEDREAPFAQPTDAEDLVRQRRLKRQLKAGLSISLALAAGAFLSCQRVLSPEEPAPPPPTSGPPAPVEKGTKPLPQAEPEPAPDPAIAGARDTASVAVAKAAESARNKAAIAPRKPTKRKRPTIDRRQHRKGMPVPDNLLE